MADLKPTLEQEAIIDAGVNGDTFVVDAVAGSGKTSTLRMASQAMAESKILYLVYNRAAADDARKVFPKNVTVKTTAAMAFGAYKGMYGDRILGPRVPANQTAAMLGLTKPLELGQDIFFRPYSLAVLAVETVDRFCHTADIEVETHHVPPLPLGLSVIQEDTLRQEVTFWARKLWKDSQNPTSKHRFTFDYAFKCQPAGTLVKIVDRKSVEGDKKRGWKPVWRDVRIEDVKPGDKVVSAGGDHYFRVMKNGSEVTRVGTRHYDGQLITVTTESGESSSYTHDHISIAAFGDDLNDKHIVYMMRKGVSHRIGKSRWKYGEDQAYFGPTSRIKHQEADGFWILSVHETAEDAALAEALACHEYNIPEWQFVPSRETVAGVPLDAFWTKVGDNSNQASRCLSDHGRDIKYPLWSKGEAPLGVRSAHEIRACNFIDGMKVCTLSGAQDGPNGQMFTRVQRGWSTVVVSRAPYAGQVYSLDVDRTHVYFGDGILTHNCWVMDEPAIYFDTVMLDEAQDSNGIVEHFIKQQYVQKVIVGDPAQQLYCQPVGTMVEVPDGRAGGSYDTKKIPVENINEGDLVVTYDNSHVYKKGRPVSHITRLKHDGRLIRVTTPSGQTSAYTDKHHCVVRVGDSLMPKHVVYMMRQGDKFRVGRTRFMYESQNWTFGVAARAKAEKADAAWILSVHDTVAESSLAESLVQHQFGIPGVRFEPTHDRDEMDVKVFWSKYDSNPEAARKCLEGHGRLIDYPLWTAGTTANPIGVRRPFVTAAANLIDGMTVLPLDKVARVRGEDEAPRRLWEEVIVTSEYYKGDIVSLEVDDHHTYFGDGILTHNSWRGAVNIMDRFEGERLSLSQSWRFGERIAEEADKWLAHTGTGIKVKGNPAMDSVVTDESFGRPDAVLCRTNATAVDRAMFYLSHGLRVAVAGGTKQLVALAYAAGELKQGKETTHQELIAFKTWKELVAFTEEPGGGDLKALVNLIQIHGVGGILDACKLLVDENKGNPDVTVSTAHKSKGREWMNVEVAADFKPPHGVPDPFGGEATPGPIPKADAMLHYVTVTRARQSLNRGGLTWIDDYADLVIDKW